MASRTTSALSFGRSMPTGAALLRPALRLDALVTGANGAAYLVLAGPLGDLLGMPPSGLRAVGGFLLAFAAVVWLVAAPAVPRAGAAWAIVGANALWVVASVALLVFGWWSPTTAGEVWVALQAGVVALLAEAQAHGLRRR